MSNFSISHIITFENSVLTVDGNIVFSTPNNMDSSAVLKSAFQNLEISYPKFYKMDILSKAAFIMAEYLMQHAKNEYKSDRVGVFLSNYSSSLETDELYVQKSFVENELIPNPALFVYTLPNIMIGEICIRHQLKGEQSMWINAEPDMDFMANYVNSLSQENCLDAALIGWVDVYNGVNKSMLCWVEKTNSMKKNLGELNGKNLMYLFNK